LDDFNLTPAELLRRLWQRKFWAIGILSTCLILGFVYLKTAAPLFDVEANLLLEPGSRLLSVERQAIGQRDNELTATQSEVLSSWHILSRAVSAYQMSNTVSPAVAEKLLLRLSAELTVKPVVGTRILNVSFRWDNREQGKILAENIIDQYQKFLLELDQGGQNDALKMLTQTEAKIRSELIDLQSKYQDVCEAGSVLGSADAGWALQQSMLQDLGTAYMEVRSRRIGLENRVATLDLEMAGTIKGSTIPASISSNASGRHLVTVNYRPSGDSKSVHEAVAAFKAEQGWAALQMLNDADLKSVQEPVAIQQELFQAEVRRQELVEKYQSKHPELRAVEKQISDWKQRLQTLVDRAPLMLERELRAAKLQEDRLCSLYDEELVKAKQVDRQRLEQQHLQKQIEQVELLHNSIIAQLTKMRLNNDVANEGGADLRVTVLQPPSSGIAPAWPNKKIVVVGSFLMGILGSSMLAFAPIR